MGLWKSYALAHVLFNILQAPMIEVKTVKTERMMVMDRKKKNTMKNCFLPQKQRTHSFHKVIGTKHWTNYVERAIFDRECNATAY